MLLEVLLLLAALKPMFVAKAVFPIAGLPANTIKSDLFKPPNWRFRPEKPVSTPDNLPFLAKASFIWLVALVKTDLKSIGPEFILSFSAKLYNFSSVSDISWSGVTST